MFNNVKKRKRIFLKTKKKYFKNTNLFFKVFKISTYFLLNKKKINRL